MPSLSGKTILITGASSGIGKATAKLLAANGAKLALVARSADRLQAVVKELQDGHPQRHIVVDFNVTRTVRCDLGRIQQVASNLIGNALTHGAPDSPVKVSAFTDDSDLVLEVWNEGEPIPADSLDKVFEPFWRYSTSVSRQGLGLGLHICSQIVRAHGGRLTVNSTEQSGTRFTARLPLQSAYQQC